MPDKYVTGRDADGNWWVAKERGGGQSKWGDRWTSKQAAIDAIRADMETAPVEGVLAPYFDEPEPEPEPNPKPEPTSRLFFAHNHTAFSHASGWIDIAGARADIDRAIALGMDGWALNAGAWDADYISRSERYFQAAEGTNFKLFMSPDGILTQDQIRDMLDRFADHPNQYYRDGRQFFSGFSVQVQTNQWWADAFEDRNPFFVPHFSFFANQPSASVADILEMLDQYPIIDGAFGFWAPSIPVDTTTEFSMLVQGRNLAEACDQKGILHLASMAHVYWGQRQPQAGRRYFDYKFGEGMEAQVRSLLDEQDAQILEYQTWNDFLESWVVPGADWNTFWPHHVPNVPGYLKDQTGAAELLKYFIKWFQTGLQPAITDDKLFYSYRTHPKDAVASADPLGPVTQRSGDVQDEIYITTLLTAPAQINVDTGGVSHFMTAPAGMSHHRVPFEVGAQRFELHRTGAELGSADGEAIIADPVHYNFWSHTGVIVGTNRL